MGAYVRVCARTCIPVGERGRTGRGHLECGGGPCLLLEQGRWGRTGVSGRSSKMGAGFEQHLITQAF